MFSEGCDRCDDKWGTEIFEMLMTSHLVFCSFWETVSAEDINQSATWLAQMSLSGDKINQENAQMFRNAAISFPIWTHLTYQSDLNIMYLYKSDW